MATLMQSPEGAQAQVSSTEAEELKKLGWKERGYADYKQPLAIKEEKVRIQPVPLQDTPQRGPGRPPKNFLTGKRSDGYSTNDS